MLPWLTIDTFLILCNNQISSLHTYLNQNGETTKNGNKGMLRTG